MLVHAPVHAVALVQTVVEEERRAGRRCYGTRSRRIAWMSTLTFLQVLALAQAAAVEVAVNHGLAHPPEDLSDSDKSTVRTVCYSSSLGLSSQDVGCRLISCYSVSSRCPATVLPLSSIREHVSGGIYHRSQKPGQNMAGRHCAAPRNTNMGSGWHSR